MPDGSSPFDRLDAGSLRDLLEMGTEGTWLYDPADDRVLWSPKLLATLGLDVRERSLPDVLELAHPDDRVSLQVAVEHTLIHGGPYRLELRMRKADGDYLWISARGALLRRPAAATGLLAGIMLDDTEFWSTKAELARSEARFRAFMDRCPAAVFIKTPDDLILYANPQAARVAGTTVETMIGSRTSELFVPETAAQLMRADIETLAFGHPVYSSDEVVARSGETRHILGVKFPVPDLDSDKTLLGGFGLDITERIEQERRLRELDRRVQEHERLESVGTLAGGIAHDFKNVLHTILGRTQLAVTEADGHVRARHLQSVLNQCSYAEELCSQLMLYAGHNHGRTRPIDPPAFLQACRQYLDISCCQGIELRIDAAPDLPELVADPVQLRQMIYNLVLNACQAIDERDDGRITLGCFTRSRPLELQVFHSWCDDEAPGYVCVAIQDNGSGMTLDAARRMFEPFFSTKPDGHGLGMSVVVGIVKWHRGSIAIDTSPGEGMRIEVCLPVRQATPGDTTGDGPDLTNRIILVVDDQPEVQATATLLAQRLGVATIAAASGDEALRLLGECGSSIDLALVDTTMPALAGADLARRIRAEHPGVVPVLTAGYDQPTAPEGSAPVLRKPFTLESLEACLRQALC